MNKNALFHRTKLLQTLPSKFEFPLPGVINGFGQNPGASCGAWDPIEFSALMKSVKALSFMIRGSPKPVKTADGPNCKDPESVFSRRDVNALKQAILGAFED